MEGNRAFLRVNLELHKPVGEDKAPQAPRSSAVSPRIETPKGVKSGKGMSPSPLGERSGKGAVPPPQKFLFLILDLNMVSFDAIWVVFFTVQLPVLLAKR